jgi:hypothetical protein
MVWRSGVRRLTYGAGEDIRKGDRITYHGEPGEVEFVVTGLADDPRMDWYAGSPAMGL